LLVFTVSLGFGLSGLACSSSTTSGGGGDEDSGTSDGGGDGTVKKDGGGDAQQMGDSGGMDGGGGDAAGNCSPLKGSCDIVSQNCPQGKECVAVSTADGGFTSQCNNTSVGQHIAKGEACSTQNPN